MEQLNPFRAIARHWKVFIGVTILLTVAIYGVSTTREPIYESQAELLVIPSDPSSPVQLEDLIPIFTSDSVLRDSVDRLSSTMPNLDSRSLGRMVEVSQPTAGSSFILVISRAGSPDDARVVAATVVASSQDRIALLGEERIQDDLDTLGQHLKELDDSIETLYARLDQLRERSPIYSAFDEAVDQWNQARIARNEAEGEEIIPLTVQTEALADDVRLLEQLLVRNQATPELAFVTQELESLIATRELLLAEISDLIGAPSTSNAISVVSEPGTGIKTGFSSAAILLVGLIVGLLAGALATNMLDGVGGKISPKMLIEESPWPFIGVVPVIRRVIGTLNRQLPTPPSLDSTEARAITMLMASIRSAVGQGSPVAFVGTERGSGTSVAAWNVAWAAAMTGTRVIVIDLDNTSTSISALFDFDDSPGFVDVAQGLARYDNCVRSVDINGQEIAILGPGRHLQAYLNAPSHKLASLFKLISLEYQLIIIDSPPLTETPSVMSLLSEAVGVVVVVAAGSDRGELEVLERSLTLADVDTAGILFNRKRARRRRKHRPPESQSAPSKEWARERDESLSQNVQ